MKLIMPSEDKFDTISSDSRSNPIYIRKRIARIFQGSKGQLCATDGARRRFPCRSSLFPGLVQLEGTSLSPWMHVC
jgi:hypothetical protein